MKDNFSTQSSAYSRFRPHYPDELIEYIISFVNRKQHALDVATGNGQFATRLAEFFDEVDATDISQKQLRNAVEKENIFYHLEPAEKTSFGDAQFDLITVAQAIHWFDFDRFNKEVYRILKPDGIIAVIGYKLFTSNPDSDKILWKLYEDILGDYWHPERKYIEDNYTTIPFPFEELPTKAFSNNLTWSFDQIEGYLESWSATQQYKDINCNNPIDFVRERLSKSWEISNKKVSFPLLLRIGKLRK